MKAARWLEYMRLDEIKPAEENAKSHDLATVGASTDRFGLIDVITLDERTGRMVAGHGRHEHLMTLWETGKDAPDGVRVEDDGVWAVPVSRGWASENDDEALAAALGLNAYVDRGDWDTKRLAEALGRLDDGPGLTGVGYDQADLQALRKDLAGEEWDPDRQGTAAARREDSIDELADNYRNKQVRTLVFDYPLGEYEETAGLAKAALGRHRVPGNAELLMALLRRWDAAHPAPAEE